MNRLTWLALIFTMGCASYEGDRWAAERAFNIRQNEIHYNTEAWLAAREKLRKACPNVPSRLAAGLRRPTEFSAQVLDSPEAPERLLSPSLFSEPLVIQDQARGCGLRLVKLSNRYALDDWGYDWLPNYSTIVRIHEEEIKARLTPRVYEEYMLGLSRYLAQQMDSKGITPRQMIRVFNESWAWMVRKLQDEAELLQRRADEARITEAIQMQALSNFAQSLATVAGAALVAGAIGSASRPTYQPAPVPPLRSSVYCGISSGMVRGSWNVNCR